MTVHAKLDVASPRTGFQAEAFQGYLQGLKMFWKEPLYQEVVKAAQPLANQPAAAIEVAMRDNVPYRLYGWLERHLQQFKYVSRYGMLPVMEAQAAALSKELDAAGAVASERLRLSPDLVLPEYYTEADFHQHPGGIWSDDVDAFAYEWGANAFSFAMVAADRPYRWLADYVVTRFAPKSVVDVGCGFGKLVIPLKERDRSMHVTGIDLAAPLLRLAHRRALEAGLEIDFIQADAERTGLPDASVDCVVSYWLLHELPPEAILGYFREARRILKPGGVIANFDMHTAPGGNIGMFLHSGHAARNNEPFLPGMIALDVRKALSETGFSDIELVDALTGEPGSDETKPLAPSRTHTFTVAIGRVPR